MGLGVRVAALETAGVRGAALCWTSAEFFVVGATAGRGASAFTRATTSVPNDKQMLKISHAPVHGGVLRSSAASLVQVACLAGTQMSV